MKKLLYITANPKKEEDSSCKRVGRKLVNEIIKRGKNIEIKEIDLYEDHIPRLNGSYLTGHSAIVSGEKRSKLKKEEQREIEIIESLCEEFKNADIYILAAPMWSLSFPPVVKEYIDCIVQKDKTIAFNGGGKPSGLLGDKPRVFIYVQSSGAHIPWFLKPAFNKGLNYVKNIMKFIGVKSFEELLVDGTGTTKEEKEVAIQKAREKIKGLLDKIL